MRVNVVDIRTQIDELTAQQVKVLDVLRGVRSARIEGSAGTGKTVLAVEKVRQLANGGFSVLLVCFNLLLAEHLKLQFDNVSAVTVTTFHALVYSLGRRAGVDFAKDPAASWWDVEAANVLVDAARKVGAEWDALVIDEGQDFHETWFPALQLLQRGEDPPLFVFADKQQAIYRPGCQLPKLPVYFLDENCRNQKLIAEKVAKIFDGPVVSRCGDGVQPLFAVAESETEIVGQIERWCERLLLEEELDPSQIVVLSDSRRIVEILRGRNVAEWSFIDYGKRGIVVETIHRFKGLEADAIIVSFAPDAWQNSPVARELAYVAFSRARGLLLVTGPARLQPLVRW